MFPVSLWLWDIGRASTTVDMQSDFDQVVAVIATGLSGDLILAPACGLFHPADQAEVVESSGSADVGIQATLLRRSGGSGRSAPTLLLTALAAHHCQIVQRSVRQWRCAQGAAELTRTANTASAQSFGSLDQCREERGIGYFMVPPVPVTGDGLRWPEAALAVFLSRPASCQIKSAT